MREHLARSLDRIGEMAGPMLADAADMAPALAHIGAHRVNPGVFARYYDLVFALQAADYPAARRLWREIADLAGSEAELTLVPFGRETLGEDAARFGRLLSMAYGDTSMFAPPATENWLAFERGAHDALDLLGDLSPAWSQELRGLLTRVIGAEPNVESAAPRFAGASGFMVWGAAFINVMGKPDRIAILSSLVHEATHQLLFAVSRDQPLVTNPPGARYQSPLRKDPRPMDGVFHATYVAARMSLLYEVLRTAGPRLSPAESANVGERLAYIRSRFRDGYAVVTAEAMLTPLGRTVMEEAAGHVLAPA
ncbi:MAG TPA: HEXXH motif-containing putative peptide modification protein [Caulobacteraceae bacterium]